MNNTATFTAPSGITKHLVILLHGYGANAQDLIGLAPELSPHLPDTSFVSPDAPFPCEMGFGRQWFSLSQWTPASMQAGVATALPLLQAYIDQQMQRWNLTDADIALVGFSQGTMMALAAATTRAKALAGVVGYSGTMIPAGPVISKPPVLLVHGTADQIVPFAALADAESKLKESGISIETVTRPGLGHGIDSPGIEAGIGFLHKIWG